MPFLDGQGGSKLPMQPSSKNRNRAAGAIEGRIGDKLIIHGAVDELPDFNVVIGFENFFPAVI
jgi:hypothetical protein